MNLQDTWKQLDFGNDFDESRINLRGASSKSKHPVARLKRAYLKAVIFSVFFLLAFVVCLFLYSEPLVRLGVVVMIAVYIVFSFVNINAYRRVRLDFPMDGNLRHVLQSTHDFIVANIRFQERFGLFVYPFATVAGFLMGLSSGSGNATQHIDDAFVLTILAVVIVILTPISWLAARWFYNRGYGTCLKELRALIEEMDKAVAP